MKKLLSITMIMAILFCLAFCINCKKKEIIETDGVLNYALQEDGTYCVVSAVDINTISENLIIPLSFNGKYVTKIGKGAFKTCNNIITVELPEELSKIGENAFWKCKNLLTVYIKSTKLNWLSNGSFASCYDLNAIYYPGTKKMWGNIYKGHWNTDSEEIVIYCSDGNII